MPPADLRQVAVAGVTAALLEAFRRSQGPSPQCAAVGDVERVLQLRDRHVDDERALVLCQAELGALRTCPAAEEVGHPKDEPDVFPEKAVGALSVIAVEAVGILSWRLWRWARRDAAEEGEVAEATGPHRRRRRGGGVLR